jgi:hypothetical protein
LLPIQEKEQRCAPPDNCQCNYYVYYGSMVLFV